MYNIIFTFFHIPQKLLFNNNQLHLFVTLILLLIFDNGRNWYFFRVKLKV